jgi:sodium/potassium-transporting ATPase subunit alpha
LIPPKAQVVRNRNLFKVEAFDIVPGDILFVHMGDKVPADAIVFHCQDLKVDHSGLTGESDFLERKPLPNKKVTGSQELLSPKGDKPPLESPHLIFAGTTVVSGEGYAIVIRTGLYTELGKLGKSSRQDKPRKSPLSLEIRRFSKLLSLLAAFTTFIFFFISLGRGKSANQSFQFAIGLLIAFIPQGLPILVTMLLTIAGRRMAQRQVLVKDLHGVETLGAITMLCTDKTGTLTMNSMHVSYVWINNGLYVADEKIEATNERLLRVDMQGVTSLLHACASCTR